jgi:hypothetical protein
MSVLFVAYQLQRIYIPQKAKRRTETDHQKTRRPEAIASGLFI